MANSNHIYKPNTNSGVILDSKLQKTKDRNQNPQFFHQQLFHHSESSLSQFPYFSHEPKPSQERRPVSTLKYLKDASQLQKNSLTRSNKIVGENTSRFLDSDSEEREKSPTTRFRQKNSLLQSTRLRKLTNTDDLATRLISLTNNTNHSMLQDHGSARQLEDFLKMDEATSHDQALLENAIASNTGFGTWNINSQHDLDSYQSKTPETTTKSNQPTQIGNTRIERQYKRYHNILTSTGSPLLSQNFKNLNSYSSNFEKSNEKDLGIPSLESYKTCLDSNATVSAKRNSNLPKNIHSGGCFDFILNDTSDFNQTPSQSTKLLNSQEYNQHGIHRFNPHPPSSRHSKFTTLVLNQTQKKPNSPNSFEPILSYSAHSPNPDLSDSQAGLHPRDQISCKSVPLKVKYSGQHSCYTTTNSPKKFAADSYKNTGLEGLTMLKFLGDQMNSDSHNQTPCSKNHRNDTIHSKNTNKIHTDTANSQGLLNSFKKVHFQSNGFGSYSDTHSKTDKSSFDSGNNFNSHQNSTRIPNQKHEHTNAINSKAYFNEQNNISNWPTLPSPHSDDKYLRNLKHKLKNFRLNDFFYNEKKKSAASKSKYNSQASIIKYRTLFRLVIILKDVQFSAEGLRTFRMIYDKLQSMPTVDTHTSFLRRFFYLISSGFKSSALEHEKQHIRILHPHPKHLLFTQSNNGGKKIKTKYFKKPENEYSKRPTSSQKYQKFFASSRSLRTRFQLQSLIEQITIERTKLWMKLRNSSTVLYISSSLVVCLYCAYLSALPTNADSLHTIAASSHILYSILCTILSLVINPLYVLWRFFVFSGTGILYLLLACFVTTLVYLKKSGSNGAPRTDQQYSTNGDLYAQLFITCVRIVTPQVISDVLFGPATLKKDEARFRCEQQFYETSGSGFLFRKILTCLQYINTADNDRVEAYALSALHTSQGYCKTVTHQLWRLTRVFARSSDNVHASIMRQPLSVEILMESREWKRFSQNLTFRISQTLHLSTALLQHNDLMRPQTIFSEFVTLRLLCRLFDSYLSNADCLQELKSLQIVIEQAKLSPLLRWYAIIAITIDCVRKQVHSSVLDHWLFLEQAMFLKIRILEHCDSPLSKARSQQLKTLHEMGILSLSSVRNAQMAKFNLALEQSDRVIELLAQKRQANADIAQSFREGRSRAWAAGSEGYFEVQCIDVLLEAAESIERRLEFMFGNLALDARWRVWTNSCTVSSSENILGSSASAGSDIFESDLVFGGSVSENEYDEKINTSYLSDDDNNKSTGGFDILYDQTLDLIGKQAKLEQLKNQLQLNNKQTHKKNPGFDKLGESLEGQFLLPPEAHPTPLNSRNKGLDGSNGNSIHSPLQANNIREDGVTNENENPSDLLLRHEQRVKLIRNLFIMRQEAVQSSGPRALAYISMYQQLCSNVIAKKI